MWRLLGFEATALALLTGPAASLIWEDIDR
jgi:hypothetical protein